MNHTQILYIFVDEAGDLDFTPKGSKHYMFSFLIKQRPFKLHEKISSYRYSLLERNLEPHNANTLDIEAFHACEDNKHIKEGMFDLISSFDKNAISVYSYILDSSASSANLQIVDYINWAIFRKYERGDEVYYQRIARYILDEEVATKDRNEIFY